MERSTPRRPDREGHHNGLAYALWLPPSQRPPQTAGPDQPYPGIVVVHGAGSRKENHADFARLATASGWAALTFDLPGHGESGHEMSGAAVDAVISMVHLLEVQEGVDAGRVAVRGSSLGGFLALCAAAAAPEIAGVIAICPASEEHLASGVRRGRFEMRVGSPVDLEAWLLAQDVGAAVERIAGRPVILMHAEGDTQIPSDHSEELYERAGEPRKLVIDAGGAHTSVQHDAELQVAALRWLERELGPVRRPQ
ncbi:MAG: alpha/beta hydrolase [Solirubrobacterales bacterium]